MSQSPLLTTMFAPPGRSSIEEVRRQSGLFSSIPLLKEFLDAIPNVFLVLNEQRQIVFANKALYRLLGQLEGESVKGKRTGEVFNCDHADQNEAGCGTTEFCRTCGAVRTILASLQGDSATSECRIAQKDGSAMDLRVSGSPLEIDGQRFSLFALEDISHEKRRFVLERLFFHDILNRTGVLLGYAEMLQEEPDDSPRTALFKDRLYQAAVRLVSEIQSQRDLLAAENGELRLQVACIHTLEFLQSIQDCYQVHEVAKDRYIQIDPQSQNMLLYSDPTLLERVLGNLVKNALEASEPGETVTLSCRGDGRRVWFEVHNPAFIPRDIQLQIFQRSFTTKGAGHGLGTYSVKLLTERYLGGTVSFTSSPEQGTVFAVSYPLKRAS